MELVLMIAHMVPIIGGAWLGIKIREGIIKTWKDESDKGPAK